MSKPFTSTKIPTQKWYKWLSWSLSSAVAIATVNKETIKKALGTAHQKPILVGSAHPTLLKIFHE